MIDTDALTSLHAENPRLTALLDAHGIAWRLPTQTQTQTVAELSRLTTDEKVALFRTLFRGRMNVYPIRWESKTSGKSGYAPAARTSPPARSISR
ncbi:hypothetical protein [Dokdonella sp.]|uniref:TOTE conflict system archaeo-eukaryotic primase domain-containing protein n=1 Tax=Dokdonella sp. TaxID=2291710 RepID=UPI0025BFD24F|nr:hypothetical protein [Dokdonella sp.]